MRNSCTLTKIGDSYHFHNMTQHKMILYFFFKYRVRIFTFTNGILRKGLVGYFSRFWSHLPTIILVKMAAHRITWASCIPAPSAFSCNGTVDCSKTVSFLRKGSGFLIKLLPVRGKIHIHKDGHKKSVAFFAERFSEFSHTW